MSIANGGTGSTTASNALVALGAAKTDYVGIVSNLNKTIVSAINELYSLIK